MSSTEVSRDQLEAGLEGILNSPKDQGIVELIVCRPMEEEREVLATAELTPEQGLVGDTWSTRRSWDRNNRAPNPEMQLNLMNARVISLVAQTRERWPLAGDQLFVDLDLSEDNLPVGTQLAIGTAIIEITPPPHTGCRKFKARYGVDAHKFVNARKYKHLHLRGVCAKVLRGGRVTQGDAITKL